MVRVKVKVRVRTGVGLGVGRGLRSGLGFRDSGVTARAAGVSPCRHSSGIGGVIRGGNRGRLCEHGQLPRRPPATPVSRVASLGSK